MPGRDIGSLAIGPQHRGSGRLLIGIVTALALVALGIAIGTRIGSPHAPSPPAADATSVRTTNDRADPGRSESARTRAGAVAAATRSITAFDGNVLLEPSRLRAVVEDIASTASQARLIKAFDQASAETRAKLGADTIPQPVILLRSVPVGYRVERFSVEAATVAVWYVGIVGSGATIDPQQSWRTQVITLVWEGRAWRIDSFASSRGPTPPLSTAEVAEPPAELFAAVPRFEVFERAAP